MRPANKSNWKSLSSSDLYALAVTGVVLLTGREPQELFDDQQRLNGNTGSRSALNSVGC